MEFTVENLNLFVLETSRALRTPRASVQIAVDMVQEKILTEREALLRIEPAQMEYFLFPTVIDEFCKSHFCLFCYEQVQVHICRTVYPCGLMS